MEDRRHRAGLQSGDAAERLLFGHSALARKLRAECRQIAPVPGSVLIEGPPGSGVAKVAEVIHLLSGRASEPFVKSVAVGLEVEGLSRAIEAAGQGSLFLNEVGALPRDAQYALLDRLDQSSGLRVLAGTTQSLAEAAGKGTFDADLYYRLEALRVRIPALRERPEDIPVLFRHYVAQTSEQAGTPPRAIPPGLLASLMAQDWPGNARALMNVAMRFALGLSPEEDREMGLNEKMAQIEASLLVDALRRNSGNATVTAQELKLPRKTFYDKLARHGIRAEDYRT